MPDLFGNDDELKFKSQSASPEESIAGLPAPLTRLYNSNPIRTAVNDKGEEVWAVIDVIAAMGYKNPKNYWAVTKRKLIAEGWDGVTKIHLMPLPDSLGRLQPTQVMTIPQIFRMLQSLPSKKAEPFKEYMAEAGYIIAQEAQNPDLAIQRGYEGLLKKGYSPAFASRRAKSVIHRKALTETWKRHGITTPREFAQLTDRESQGIFGKTTREMKRDRDLEPSSSLRDEMTLSEITAQDVTDTVVAALAEKEASWGYSENAVQVDRGSEVGAKVLADLEKVLEA